MIACTIDAAVLRRDFSAEVTNTVTERSEGTVFGKE
jgi:hypothetical protein